MFIIKIRLLCKGICCKIRNKKDLRLAMNLSEEVAQPMSVVGSSNELFKRAVAQGHGDRDMASVYRIVNHSDLDHS